MAVATAAAVVLGAASATMSFVQAGKQSKLARSAQRDADEAFAAAEKQMDINYMEQLSISKQPYLAQREALNQVASQAIGVGAESERQAAATAGRVLAQSQKSEQAITNQQIKEIQGLETLVATEEGSLRDKRAELNLAQAEGAGIAAAQAMNARNKSLQAGVTSLGNMATSLYKGSELYSQNPDTPDTTTTPEINWDNPTQTNTTDIWANPSVTSQSFPTPPILVYDSNGNPIYQ